MARETQTDQAHGGYLMKFIIAALLLGSTAYANVSVPIDSTYKLTFDDEFNGTNVNVAHWNKGWFGTGTNITKPTNSAETAAYDPAQCTVASGHLKMTAIQKTVVDQFGKSWAYATCGMNTMNKFDQAYGYAEARMFLPASGTKIANWPGFWANGYQSTCGTWPCAGENDIMEGLGGYAHWHFHGPNNYNPGGGPNTNLSGWHIFAALWQPGTITYYYDGVSVGSISSSNITSAKMAYLLQNSVSPADHYGGPMLIPATVLVDYVHVYSKDASAVAITPEANYGGPGANGAAINPCK